MDVLWRLLSGGESKSGVPAVTVSDRTGRRRPHSLRRSLVHSDFSGQGVAEDLRAIARRPLTETALEVALKVTDEQPAVARPAPLPETERYLVVDSDPSQECAVAAARRTPGLLIEGPPGTVRAKR